MDLEKFISDFVQKKVLEGKLTAEEIQAKLDSTDLVALLESVSSKIIGKVWDKVEVLNEVEPEIFFREYGMGADGEAAIIQVNGETIHFQATVPGAQGFAPLSKEDAEKIAGDLKEEEVKVRLTVELHNLFAE